MGIVESHKTPFQQTLFLQKNPLISPCKITDAFTSLSLAKIECAYNRAKVLFKNLLHSMS